MAENINNSSEPKPASTNNLSENMITLSNEQQLFIEKALAGNNILVDACIGSGKTTAIQQLCNEFPDNLSILYLTYNTLLKIDAKDKIKKKNVTVTNYHSFALAALKKASYNSSVQQLVYKFNYQKPPIRFYDILIIDEYQDIEQELADMLEYIKSCNPAIQLIAVGDMAQKIYDRSPLNVSEFINTFLGQYLPLRFTNCFRLSAGLANFLGRVWQKEITGVNSNCHVQKMSFQSAVNFLSECLPEDILCLGRQSDGDLTRALNLLEEKYPQKFNKYTTYASIRENDNMGKSNAPKKGTAIFTTYDSCKGLERKICVVFDFTEKYWQKRSNSPQQNYEILRNIFCVAASRGKEYIIFVENNNSPLLSEKSLSKRFEHTLSEGQLFSISKMFDYKYPAAVNACADCLHLEQLPSDDCSTIEIKNKDGLIDLSPCIGEYQEFAFFQKYSIELAIQDFFERSPKLESLYTDELRNATVDEKILFLTALETGQDRYRQQVRTPFVQETERSKIIQRLGTLFSPDEKVQTACSIAFASSPNGPVVVLAIGRTDVIKDDIVYELKFVSELANEHFLQCACYMIALGLKKGVLWNVKNNTRFQITIPDEKAFLDAVVNTITKGEIPAYYAPGRPHFLDRVAVSARHLQKYFAVIDTETTFKNQTMSIGIVIADRETFKEIDSRYYILTPEYLTGGMFSSVLTLNEHKLTKICSRDEAISELLIWLKSYEINSLFAYNAAFDKNQLFELYAFFWFDIMKIAAYKRFNNKLPPEAEYCKNGRLKRNYSMEAIYNLLHSTGDYIETHNALQDALDELELMRMLEQPFSTYQYARLPISQDVTQVSSNRPLSSTRAKMLSTAASRDFTLSHSSIASSKSFTRDTSLKDIDQKNDEAVNTDSLSTQIENDGKEGQSHLRTETKQLYTVSDLVAMFNISRNQVYNLIHCGLLSAEKQGNKYVISQESINNYQLYLKQLAKKNAIVCAICVIIFIGLLFFLIL